MLIKQSCDNDVKNPSINKRSSKLKIVLLIWALSLMVVPNLARDYAYGICYERGAYMPDSVFDVPSSQTTTEVHTWRIFNLRPRRLSVDLEPSCGCLATSWHHTSIVPFGFADFAAKMEMHGSGAEQQTITVRTDDPKHRFLFAIFSKK